MSDKILCPYCGAEMVTMEGFTYANMLCPMCESRGPRKKSRLRARFAAWVRYTPPVKPLVLEELDKKVNAEFPDTLWLEFRTGKVIPVIADRMDRSRPGICVREEDALEVCDNSNYNKTWRCWPRKPTKEEREAAEWQ